MKDIEKIEYLYYALVLISFTLIMITVFTHAVILLTIISCFITGTLSYVIKRDIGFLWFISGLLWLITLIISKS